MEVSGAILIVFFFNLGSFFLISNDILQAITNDDSGITNRTIYFTVINPPKFGKLVKLQADKTTTDISSFTQQMVSVSNLFFTMSVPCILECKAMNYKFILTMSII